MTLSWALRPFLRARYPQSQPDTLTKGQISEAHVISPTGATTLFTITSYQTLIWGQWVVSVVFFIETASILLSPYFRIKKETTSQTEFGKQMRSPKLMLFCLNLAHFSKIQLVCDLRTDRRTDGRTHPLIEMRKRI